MTREKILIDLISSLDLILFDLIRIIVDYEPKEWNATAQKSWSLETFPMGMCNYQNQISICERPRNVISIKDLNGLTILTNYSLVSPAGIDIDPIQALIFVSSSIHITIFNLKFEFIACWQLPGKSDFNFRGIKVDQFDIYLTICSSSTHQIFKCNSLNGRVLNKYGKEERSSCQGEFYNPLGITLNKANLYICDCNNQRVQVLNKDTGKFIAQWGEEKGKEIGQFWNPFSIYNNIIEEMIYIGDNFSIQLFSKDGICRQRIGSHKEGNGMDEFARIYGICIVNDELYVSDSSNKRIQICRRFEDINNNP